MQRILTLKTITPLHVGTGQSVGTTDLPIARERATGWPAVPGSGVKGVLKEASRVRWMAAGGAARRSKESGRMADEAHAYLFGSPSNDAPSAGALSITDLRCLLFPVRSLAGTFAYATSPLALARASELLRVAGQPGLPSPTPPPDGVWIAPGSVLAFGAGAARRVYLEDLDLQIAEGGAEDPSEGIARLIGGEVRPRLSVLADDMFTFLTQSATEVVTHVSLEFETRTARPGFLRSEERVPAEAAFVGLATLDPLHFQDRHAEAVKALAGLDGTYEQFGGKASVGNGLCRIGVVA